MNNNRSNTARHFFNFGFRMSPEMIVEIISGLFFLLFLYATAYIVVIINFAERFHTYGGTLIRGDVGTALKCK